jgi:hypothetical protein
LQASFFFFGVKKKESQLFFRVQKENKQQGSMSGEVYFDFMGPMPDGFMWWSLLAMIATTIFRQKVIVYVQDEPHQKSN